MDIHLRVAAPATEVDATGCSTMERYCASVRLFEPMADPADRGTSRIPERMRQHRSQAPAPRAERSARGRSDRCRPRPRGMVEALVGYAGADLLVPGVAGWVGLAAANQAVVAWCAEVNARCAQRPAPRQPSGWRRSGRCCDHCLACGRRCAVARPARSIGWRPYASARPAISYWSTIPSILLQELKHSWIVGQKL